MDGASLAFAIPSVIDVIIRGAKVVVDRIDAFQTVDETIAW